MSDVDVDPIRVVHVDDDPEIVELAATFLQREDDRLTVEAAETGGEALDRVGASDVHCVVSDYGLPDTSLSEFLADLDRTAPGVPVVLFTGRERSELEADLLADLAAYVQKGSGTDQYTDLAAAIRDAVSESDHAAPDGGRRRSRTADEGGNGDDQTGRGTAGLGAIADTRGTDLAATLLDAIPEPVFVTNDAGSLVHWNEAVRTRTGYDDATLADLPPEHLFTEDDREAVATALSAALDDGTATRRVALGRRDGTTLAVSLTATRLTDAGGEPSGVLAVVRDRTEQAAYERELARQRGRLEEVVSSLSHDLRNPLNVVSGRIQLARESGDEEHFTAMERSSERMGERIDDLVALARKGGTVAETEPTDVDEVASTVWEHVPSDGATLEVDSGVTVQADPERVRLLLRHVLENSAVHGEGAVTVRVDALDGPAGPGFVVADDGPGIPADKLDRLREYGETTEHERTGLGLALVERVAQAHGWSLSVTESEAEGVRVEAHTGGLTPPR